MSYIRIFSLVILTCTWSVLRAQINGTDYENSVVVTSLSKNPFTLTFEHVNVFPGTLYNFQEEEIKYTYFGLQQMNTALLSVDVNYAKRCMYIFDRYTAAVYAVDGFDWENSFSSLSLRLVHDGLSRYSARLSVDWVSNNIYWTDHLFGWIVVQSDSKKDTYKILVKDDLERPYALVVSPIHKYMFWSDVGSTVKIERASLTGKNRETIISTGLAFPTSFAIDYWTDQLVWVDSMRDTVEMSDLDGKQRKVLRRMSHTDFYDVAVFRDLISVTDTNNGSLVVLNKNTGALVNSFTKKTGDPFVAISLNTAEIQKEQEDLCKAKGCSHLCVHEKDGPVCMCNEGFELELDGLGCTEDFGAFHRALMWSNSSHICMIDIRSLTSNGHMDIFECFFQDGTSITHFDIDMIKRKVIFADGQGIYSKNIGDSSASKRLTATSSDITGIAVDWRDNNVYWCMGTTTGTINLFSEEKLVSYTLIENDLKNPRDLKILPFHNTIVWISGTSGAYKIEKSELAGSERKTLRSLWSLQSPTALTIDYSTNILYFIDSGYVKSCNIDGKQLTVLEPSTAFNGPKLVLTYKNYLVVADSDFPTSVLKIYEKRSDPVLKYILSEIDADDMTDVKVLDPVLQPYEIGPCAILNGDCEHICIPIGRNRVCRCEYGFELDSNKETCSSTALTDDFLLVTDWTHNQIYQISLVNDDVIGVDTDTYGSPIGIVYHDLTKQVVWSSNTQIHGIGLNGTNYTVILNSEPLGCHADRLAVDYSTGNIYYSANQFTSAGFVGIGVVSPGGLHKSLIRFGKQPRAIVLDPEDGLLFWTDHGYEPAFVRKANMDGTNLQTVLATGLVWPNGLAIDTNANMLYVTDGATNVIRRCTYTGVCSIHYTDPEAHLMDIELLGNYLYYTAWNRPYVTKLHKTDNSSISRVAYKPELGRLDAVSLYSSSAPSPPVSSACATNNGRGPCSTFCLPIPSGYTCGCEDGVLLQSDGKTCENVKTTPTTTTSSTTTPSTTTTTPSTTTTTTTSTTPSSATTPTSTPFIIPTTTEKEKKLPIPIIVGGAVGLIIFVVIIVVLVIVILKRSRNTNGAPRNEFTNPYQTGFDISFIAGPPVEQQRPDSTYDLIKFDEEETKLSKENTDNEYMSLSKKNDYEKLGVLRRHEEDIQKFRPSAQPNEYQTMSATTRTESAHSLDDYLIPVAGQDAVANEEFNNQALVTDEEFNSPVYVGEPADNIANPLHTEKPESSSST